MALDLLDPKDGRAARERVQRPRANIRFKTTMHGTVVYQVMLWRGWTEVEEEYDWDIFWCADSDIACDLNV